MTFLSPITAAIAAAIAIPTLVILYFLKLRRRDLEVSSTLLWKKAIEDLQANAPFQKLRNNILLILQLLALLAALFALAQPQISSSLLSGGKHIIMIDRSASMRATDGDAKNPGDKTSRLDGAKKQALELVSSLREPGFFGSEGDQAMVIAFDTQADILQPFTNNKVELRRAIEAITPTDNRTTFADAFKLAKAHLPKKLHLDDKGDGVKKQDELYEGSVNIHLFSDGRLPDLDQVRLQNDNPGSANRDELSYHVVGEKDSWNMGIVSMRADREYDKPSKVSVFVSIQSTSTKPRTVDVELRVEGSVVAVKPVEVPAATKQKVGVKINDKTAEEEIILPENRGVIFEIDRAEAAVVTAKLIHPAPAAGDSGDVLATDDVGYLAVPPSRRLTVAVVTDGNLWLRLALEGLRLARPAKFVATAQADAFLKSPEAAEYDVVVLDRWLPTVSSEAGKAAPGLPAGRWLVMGAVPPAPIGLDDLGPGKQGIVLSWKRDHPVLRGVQLDDLSFTESRSTALAQNSAVTSIADGPTGPLILDGSDLTRRAIIVTFNPLQSNWPLKPSGLLFLAKALDYLGRDAMDMQSLSAQPGQTLSQRLPRDASAIRLTLPDKSKPVSLLPQKGGDVIFGPLKDVGIYTLEWDGSPGGADVSVGGRARRAVSVNLGDSFESDVTPRLVLQTASRIVSAEQSGPGGGTRRLWPWLLLGMLAVLVVEWYVYNRKVAI